MDIRRVVLFSALGLVAYTLWMDWQKEVQTTLPPTHPPVVVRADNPLLPEMKSQDEPAPNPEAASSSTSNIHVITDVLDVSIDLKQGDVVGAKLLAYPTSVTEKNTPFVMLQNQPDDHYVANSSLFTVQNQDIKPLDVHYETSQSEYTLPDSAKELTVVLKGQTPDGLSVTKQLIFTRGSYLINVDYTLTNHSGASWKGYMNTQLLRNAPQASKSLALPMNSYTGASYSNPGVHRYKKVSFKDMTKANLDLDVTGGWIAMQQHYFLSAWIPSPEKKSRFYTRARNQDFTIGSVSNPIDIAPDATQTVGAQLYIGPEIASVLHTISPGLDLTVDYGWLWFLSSMLFSLMSAIHGVIGNWGWSIVLVTVLVKLLFYKLSATSYKSMANMRRLQPKIMALRERYGNDKAKMSQATMEFYRQEKINPLGGCLPILIQIPVFIALYWVLIESVYLRQAPFIFWIKDLAVADPYHVLPILMGISMLIQQRLNPAPPDPTQAKMMMFLPVLFTALFWSFPAGLALYSIVNNTLSILQQWYITRKFSDTPAMKLAK